MICSDVIKSFSGNDNDVVAMEQCPRPVDFRTCGQTRFGADLVRIPKLAFWNYEREVFYNLEKFIELVNALCRHRRVFGYHAPPIAVLRDLISVNRYPISYLNDLFYLLRDACFAYIRPTEKQPPSTGSRLFKDEWLTGWQRQKLILKCQIKKHTKCYQPMRELHKKVLKSQKDEEQCRNLMDKTKRRLKNSNLHGSEYDQQVALIKAISLRLEKYHARLMEDLYLYAKKFRKEKRQRYKMLQVAGPLEFDIVSHIRKKLNEAVENIERICPGVCRLTSADVVKISEYLFDITCQRYVFWNSSYCINTPEFKMALPRTYFEPSDVNYGFEEEIYGSHNMAALVLEDTNETDEFYLPLKKGDTVRLRMLSADKSVGFGWIKKSRFTIKKWGFFRMSNVTLAPNAVL